METKPGYKTSEFWLMLAAQVLTLLFAAGVVAEGSTLHKVLALAASVLGALGYAVVRGAVKKTVAAATAVSAAPDNSANPT
jgi:hypothetical protein